MLSSKLTAIIFCPISDRQSYINLLYLFMTILLGIAYLAFPFVLFFSGMPIEIGAPLALLVLPILPAIATFERLMIRVWLKLDIPALTPVKEKRIGWWKRFRTFMDSGVIWKNLAYVLVKAIFGTLISGIALSIFVTSFFLFFGALAYAITMGMDLLLHIHLFSEAALERFTLSIIIQIVPFAGIGNLPVPLAFLRLGLTALLGPIIFIGAIHLINGLVMRWKRFALYTLSASKKDLQLIEARHLVEQERAKADLADQKRRELITNVSHELRTPVASIQGHVESLLNAYDETETKLPPPEVLRHYLSIAHRESLRLGTLVDDLLALARAETNELHLKMEAIAAGEVVEEVYQTLMPLARRERQIVLVHQVEPILPLILADRQRLTQVLLNLVRNAITFTPDGGIVSISLHKADDSFLALLVSDTGIGIPPEDLERVFERFYRSDASRSRHSGGAGLGLAIIRDFVLAMKGSISVESTVGEGSTFRVLLPIVPIDRQ